MVTEPLPVLFFLRAYKDSLQSNVNKSKMSQSLITKFVVETVKPGLTNQLISSVAFCLLNINIIIS